MRDWDWRVGLREDGDARVSANPRALDAWDERDVAIPFSELVESLRGLELERADLAGAVACLRRPQLRLSPSARRPHYEALVLCWKSGQRSPIHNHLGSSCVVKVVEGRATETNYVPSPCGKLVPERSRTFAAGSVTGCRDAAIHQMAKSRAARPRPDHLACLFSAPVVLELFHTRRDHARGPRPLAAAKEAENLVVDFGQSMPIAAEGSHVEVSTSTASIDDRPVIAIIGGGFMAPWWLFISRGWRDREHRALSSLKGRIAWCAELPTVRDAITIC